MALSIEGVPPPVFSVKSAQESESKEVRFWKSAKESDHECSKERVVEIRRPAERKIRDIVPC